MTVHGHFALINFQTAPVNLPAIAPHHLRTPEKAFLASCYDTVAAQGLIQMKTLAVLGSTGSIGTNTLDVVRRNRGEYRIFALAAGKNTGLLVQQILEFQPKVAVVGEFR